MSFPHIIITEAGQEAMAKVFAGAKLQFTKFTLGSGECGNNEDWASLSSVIHSVMDVNISAYKQEGDLVVLQGEFSNSQVDAEFWWRELAIYATLPELDNFGEIMFFYGNAEDLAEFVPSADAAVAVTHRWDTTLAISSAADVTAIVHSITYATVEQLNKHITDEGNPHKVTAKQVGLGNVPNVATNDQTPTYEPAKGLLNLVSGETLSAAFAKLAIAVKSLIGHMNATDNPHKLDYDSVKAAIKNHRSEGTEFGMATTAYYGHVKLSNAINSSLGSGNGIAATPVAVKSAYDHAETAHSVVGSYMGQGRSGVDTPNSITFPNRLPKMVQIMEEGTNWTRRGFLFLHPEYPCGYTVCDGYETPVVVSIHNNTVYWYYNSTESHPANQLDNSISRYVYVGIY